MDTIIPASVAVATATLMALWVIDRRQKLRAAEFYVEKFVSVARKILDDSTVGIEAKSFISVNPGPPTCTEAAGVVTCNLGSLAANDGAPGGADETTVVITFQAPKTGRDGPQDNLTVTNCAEVSASNEPPENVGPENQDCDEVTVLWKCPDVNKDGDVSLLDLALIALHWRHDAPPNVPTDDQDQQLDLNNDGTISLGDLAQVALHWRETCLL